MNKKAFTLLELLVVVLIIGILVAIAIPKYQLSVDKSLFRKYQAMVVSLKDAYNDYMMRNGKGTSNFNDLSFSLPSDFKEVYQHGTVFTCVQNSDMFCCMSNYKKNSHSAILDCGKNDLSLIAAINFANRDGEILSQRSRCYADANNARATRVCKSFGGTTKYTSNIWTPKGLKENMPYYYVSK